jgi:hypothetical protein
MKTKRIKQICPNCAYSEFIEDGYGFQRYRCKEENVVMNIYKKTDEIGIYGIWSKECLLFKQV